MLRECHSHKDCTLRSHSDLAHNSSYILLQIQYMSSTTTCLWHLYHSTTRSHTSVSFVTTSHDPPPIDTLPITTHPTTDQNNRLRIYPYSNREETIIFQQPPATSFTQFLGSLPTHERWVIGHVLPQSLTDMHNLLDAVLIGDFGLGSDGSVKGPEYENLDENSW